MNGVHLLLFVHLLGVVLWVGGISAVAVAAGGASDGAHEETAAALRAGALRVATPGMVLAWLGGLAMLIPHFGALYAHAGWMHAKLALVVVASGLSGAITAKLRKAASGERPLEGRRLSVLGLAMVTIAVVVVFLATVKPGS